MLVLCNNVFMELKFRIDLIIINKTFTLIYLIHNNIDVELKCINTFFKNYKENITFNDVDILFIWKIILN